MNLISNVCNVLIKNSSVFQDEIKFWIQSSKNLKEKRTQICQLRVKRFLICMASFRRN